MELKILKKKKVFRKGGLHIEPELYWGVLLIAVLVMIVSSFVFGFFLFKTINKGFIFNEADSETQAKKISKDRIDKALSYFEEREKKSKSISVSPSPIVDPSR